MTDVTPEAPEADLSGAGLAADRERLARDLRDARMQLAMAQTRLTAMESSASWQFGRIVARAAKNPLGRGARLPRDLYKLWRDRGASASAPVRSANALASASLTDLAGSGERFLSSLTTPGVALRADPALALSGGAFPDAARGPVITGALSPLGRATLAPDAVVHPLLPHDADVVIEGVGADLVVIEAAALLPGSPWAFATDPAAADRGRRLARMIVMARALSLPVLLVRNVPRSLLPGLSWLAPLVDAVLEEDFGVQLARFNPVGVFGDRPVAPVYAGDRDPREAPGVRGLLDELVPGDVALAGARSWRELPALYQSHGVFLTASSGQRLEQQASGARVVGLGGVRDADEVRSQLEKASAAGPLSLPEIRAGLREIFTRHATPVKLTSLVQAAGLPAQLAGGRQVAVLARVRDAAGAGRLGDALRRQRLRPAEVLVAASGSAAPAAARDALSDLADQGVRVVVTDEASGETDWARPLARLADAPWVAPWPEPGPADPAAGLNDTYLLDLACARECTRADAVGLGDAEYEFVPSLSAPALVRRGLLTPDGPPAAAWGGHGLRLFTVTR